MKKFLPMNAVMLDFRLENLRAGGDIVLTEKEVGNVKHGFNKFNNWPVRQENNLRRMESVLPVAKSLGGTPISCPECGTDMRLRVGKYSPYWGCRGYPECRKVIHIPVGDHPDFQLPKLLAESEDDKREKKSA